MNRTILFFVLGISFFAFHTALGQDSEIAKTLSFGVLNERAKELTMPSPVNLSFSGNVVVQIKIDLQKGEVVSAKAVAGHPLLRSVAEAAAKKAKFAPVLQDFATIYATGVLIYRIEDFNGKIIENKKPKLLPLIEFRTAIINGKAVKLEKPEYSDAARNNCAAGKVEVLTLLHSGSGEVFAARAISGDESLFDASEKAVMRSKFAPSNVNGDNNFYVLSKVVYNFDSLVKCITTGIANQRAIELPLPQVPNLGKPHLRITVEQIVGVRIIVDENGKVSSANAVSGHSLLRAACVNAAWRTKFSPTRLSIPIKVKALLVYKFKPDGGVVTNIESDDQDAVKTPTNLVEPQPPFCNCRIGGQVSVEAKTDAQGNVTEAKAFSGHPLLRKISENAALESKFLPTNLRAKIRIDYNFESTDGGRTAKLENIEIKEVKIIK